MWPVSTDGSISQTSGTLLFFHFFFFMDRSRWHHWIPSIPSLAGSGVNSSGNKQDACSSFPRVAISRVSSPTPQKKHDFVSVSVAFLRCERKKKKESHRPMPKHSLKREALFSDFHHAINNHHPTDQSSLPVRLRVNSHLIHSNSPTALAPT